MIYYRQVFFMNSGMYIAVLWFTTTRDVSRVLISKQAPGWWLQPFIN